ncbi:MAG: hypothetical protein OH319_04820 [Candidatus Parvarchaeota archaeon]|nr:hypothetical protein [Candidatus Jingweiarchaeum tengchongense]MCW1311121.1 hypothetical protein [Candidatus Jingweiarchaeum tengchongense]
MSKENAEWILENIVELEGKIKSRSLSEKEIEKIIQGIIHVLVADNLEPHLQFLKESVLKALGWLYLREMFQKKDVYKNCEFQDKCPFFKPKENGIK